MFREFFITLKRNKLSFVLNLIGLSVAFTILTVIAFQVFYEFGYNRSYKDKERIFLQEYYDRIGTSYSANYCVPGIEDFAKNIPEIEAYCAIQQGWDQVISTTDSAGKKMEYWESFFRVTPGFFDVFSPEIVAGDPKTCLEGEYSVALSENIAKKFFGTESALGKNVNIGNTPVTVTLVYKDFPENSSMKNGVLYRLKDDNWSEWSYLPYYKLAKGALPEEVAKKINERNSYGGQTESGEKRLDFYLTPIKDIYFTAKSEIGEKGNLNTTLCLIAIAIIIIGIAYVNFINFSTALAPVRIKRLNTQKVMGAMQGQLQRGIIFESLALSLVAFGLSLVWTSLFTASPISDFFTANLDFGANWHILAGIGVIACFMGVIAGIYPAYYMTSFSPALVLKGTFPLTPKGIRLRNALLLFQFITTIVLITVAVFIKLQHQYMQNMSLGYDRENIVYVSLNDDLHKQLNAFENELRTRPEIKDFTTSSFLPGQVGMGWGRPFDGQTVNFYAWPVAHNFLRFFNIRIAEGTDFFAHNEKGVNKIIFNRKFVEKFGIENIIGKEIGCFRNMGQIVGVAENINFRSVREEITPMAFVCGDDQGINYALIKVSGTNLPETIGFIHKTFRQFSDKGGDVKFLDETMNQMYQKEANFAKLISIFGLITIVIALMGIYGLILFNARYKVKEIGIRKVNGATESQMLVLLNKGFLKLIGISFVLAVPVAWYIVNVWLAGFPYRVAVYWWVFLLAGVITLLITLLTVSYQSWKAATVNPVETLNNE